MRRLVRFASSVGRHPPRPLEGKSVLVTGGSRGIGERLCAYLAARGARIAVCGRSLERCEQVASSLSGSGHVSVECDVRTPQSVKAAVRRARDEFGSLNSLVNAAGVVRDDLLVKAKAEDVREMVDTNILGALFLTQEAGKVMMRQRSGSIVHIGSVVGLDGNTGQAGYAATKAALLGLTKTAAKELGRTGIRVNVVAPGFVSTGMTDNMSLDARERVEGQTPLGRMGTPDDVAAAVAFLINDDSAFVTGEVIRVDGGLNL